MTESFVMLIIGLALGGLIAGLGIVYSKFSERISELEDRIQCLESKDRLNYRYRSTPYYDYLYRRRNCQNYGADEGIPVKDEKEEEADD